MSCAHSGLVQAVLHAHALQHVGMMEEVALTPLLKQRTSITGVAVYV